MQPKAHAQDTTPDKDKLTYENSELGIRIQYPADWDYSEGDPLTFMPPSKDAWVSIRSVEIRDSVTGYVGSGMSIEDVAKTWLAQFNGIPCQIESVTPNEDISVLIRMSCETDEDKKLDHAFFFLRQNNNGFLMMDYAADIDIYSHYSNAVIDMIGSIEFTDGSRNNNS